MELKLRAWDGHKMQYNFTIDSEDGMPRLTQYCVDGEPGTMVPHYKVMLSTGLKDKNDNEIYCGDLIKNDRGRTCKVVWHELRAGFDADYVSDDGTSPNPSIDSSYGFKCHQWQACVEVVGNIHADKNQLKNTPN